eukprot:525253_1
MISLNIIIVHGNGYENIMEYLCNDYVAMVMWLLHVVVVYGFPHYVSSHYVLYIKHKKLKVKKLKVKKLKGTKVKETKVKKLKGEKVKKVNETSVKGTYDIVYKGKVEKGEELEPKGKGTSGG